jgi:hypothetical protein
MYARQAQGGIAAKKVAESQTCHHLVQESSFISNSLNS